MGAYDTSAGWSSGLTKALGRKARSSAKCKRQRKAKAPRARRWAYCEQAWCEAGTKWRATRPEAKWRAIDEPKVEQGNVQQGTGLETRAPAEGSEEPGRERVPVQMPAPRLLQADRSAVATVGAEGRADTSKAPTASQDEPSDWAGETGIPGIRAGSEERSRLERARPEDRTGRPEPGSPSILPSLQAKDSPRVGEDSEETLAFTAPRRVGSPGNIGMGRQERERIGNGRKPG